MRLLDKDRTLIHACDRDGMTPLHVAARRNRMELVSVAAGEAGERPQERPDVTSRHSTMLRLGQIRATSARNGFPQVAALLLKHGAALTVRAAVALGDLPRVRQFIADEPELLRRIRATADCSRLP